MTRLNGFKQVLRLETLEDRRVLSGWAADMPVLPQANPHQLAKAPKISADTYVPPNADVYKPGAADVVLAGAADVYSPTRASKFSADTYVPPAADVYVPPSADWYNPILTIDMTARFPDAVYSK